MQFPSATCRPAKYLYPTVEEQAANFLYLVIKNHAFIDGNKRIAATLFIYFLEHKKEQPKLLFLISRY